LIGGQFAFLSIGSATSGNPQFAYRNARGKLRSRKRGEGLRKLICKN